MALKTAVMAMNDTMGLGVLVSSLLIFGIITIYASAGIGTKLLNQCQLNEAVGVIRYEYTRI